MQEMSEIPAEITADSRIQLRPLSMRDDGDEWILGSVDDGEFIAVPAVALRIVKLLGEGLAVGEVESRLAEETGHTFAIADFVAALDDAGFISAIDGEEQRIRAVPGPSLAWLQPGHVRFLLNPAFSFFAISLIAGEFIALVFRHQAGFSYHTIVWTRYSGLAIAVSVAIGWLIILLHELAHLVTARAAGAPARITLGTRLRFLVAQTDVSGIWTAPRRIRIIVYLAGMYIDLFVAISCLLVLDYARPAGVPGQLAALAAVEAFLMLPAQFMVFMRTDLYFVLQDLTKAPNLYTDGVAYLRYIGMKTVPSFIRIRRDSERPAGGPAPVLRGWIKIYAVAVLIGSAICIVTEFTISIPALIILVINGLREFRSGFIGVTDGLAAISIIMTAQILWLRSWYQRHGRRLLNRPRST